MSRMPSPRSPVGRWAALVLMACLPLAAVEITGLSPTIGTPVGGTTVTITGAGLTGTSAVLFGGTAAMGITVVNDTTVTCLTPTKPLGSVVVSLTSPGGTATSPVSFAYVAQSPSPKKGVGLWSTSGSTAGLQNIRSAWAYNWGPEPQGFTLPVGTSYVPMIWGTKNLNTTDLTKAKAYGPNLLGFNEPDHTDQSNMTVDQALAAWPQLMATGMRLGSPSPANNAYYTNSWLDLFMKGAVANNYRVDYICVHWYGPNYDAAYATSRLKSYLESTYTRYKKPIWVTELALKNWTSGAASATPAQQAAFMKLALPMLESLPYVERYAWFCLPPGWSDTWSLTDSSGALLTQGVAYRDVATYATGIPATPTGLVATQVPGTTQVNLAWTDAANNDAGTRIERKIGATGTWAELDVLYAPDQRAYSNTALTAGTTYVYRVATFNADGRSVVSNESSVTLLANVAPTVAVAAAAAPTTVIGKTTSLSALGADVDGGEANLTYTWATTGSVPAGVAFSPNGTNAAKTSTATFAKAGTYNLRVTIKDAGGLSVISNTVAVTVSPTLTSVAMTPAAATFRDGVTERFTASARDQFGYVLATQPALTWSLAGLGTLDATGLYTAPASGTGTATVQASTGTVSGAAAVTVTASGNLAPTVVTAAAGTPTTVTGTTTTLSILGTDDGGETALTYTWATTGTPPAPVTFNVNGTNAAKTAIATFTKPGSYTLQGTLRDAAGLTVTSSVAITVNATTKSVVLTPSTVSLANGATQTFTASAKDQFGVTMTTQPTFSWSVLTGGVGGTVTSAGLYTAPATGTGTSTVRATGSGVSGTATVTVTTTIAAKSVIPTAPATSQADSANGRDGGCGVGGGLAMASLALMGLVLRRRR